MRLALTSLSATLVALFPLCSSGQRTVRESYAQWQAARVLPISVSQRWCVSADAPGCDMRAMINAVSLPDGGMLVSDMAGPMRRLSSTGDFVGELGRRGQGPGEYGFLVDLQILPSGYVTWFDNTQMRIASISLDGKPGPVRRLLPPPTMASINVVGEDLAILDVPASAAVGDTVDGVYRTVPASGAPRVLGRVRTPSLFQPGTDMRPATAPFTPRIVASVGWSGDIAHSNGGQYVVEVMPSTGPRWRLEIAMPVRAVTGAERDSVLAQLLTRFKLSTVAALPARERDRLDRSGRTVPPLQAVKVLRDGTVWIQPTVPLGEQTTRWDIFSRDGRRIGCVRLPHGARVTDGMSDWVVVVERGTDDVPVATRYAVGK